MESTVTDTPATNAALFKEISKNGINVDLPGLVKKVSELQREEAESLDELDAVAGFTSLKRDYPDAFKKDTRFNPRSAKHINA